MFSDKVLAAGCGYNPAGNHNTDPKHYYNCDIGPLQGCEEYQTCEIWCDTPDGATATCGAVGTHHCIPECDGGGTCFLPGTQVATPQGDKSIETLKPGDAVFSFNELTGKRVLNTVQNSPVRTVQEYYIIKTQSGREVKTTAEHPFLTKVGSQRDAGAGTSGKLEALGDLVRLIRSKLVSITGGLK